jgi:hypothetical protein
MHKQGDHEEPDNEQDTDVPSGQPRYTAMEQHNNADHPQPDDIRRNARPTEVGLVIGVRWCS